MNLPFPGDLAGNTPATALELGWLDLNPFVQNFSDAVGIEDVKYPAEIIDMTEKSF